MGSAPLPRLAFVYFARSFPTLAISQAAKGICELIWVIDSADPAIGNLPRLLARTGQVVDIAGLDTAEAAEAIAALEPDGILTLADRLIEKTAALAEHLDLPYMSRPTATALADKHAQRNALRTAGLETPGVTLLDPSAPADVWADATTAVRLPAVLKPRRGEGSRDTYDVATADDLRALHASLTAAGARHEFILEELIGDYPSPPRDDGLADYVSVESVVSRGRITHLAVTGRTPLAEPFRETGLFIPAALEEDELTAVLDVAERAAAAMGIERGCLHTEIKLTASGPVVIEVNGRMGGILPEMLGPAFGIDIIPIAMRLALGEDVVLPELPAPRTLVYRLYLQPPTEASRVRSVDGIEAMRSYPGVTEVTLNKGAGERVDWREGSQGYVLNVVGTANDHAEFALLRTAVDDTIRVEWDRDEVRDD